MSDSSAGSVDVEVRAALEPFQRGLQQAHREARTFNERASRSMRGVQRSVRTMTEGLGRARTAVFSLQGALVGLGAGLILRRVVRVAREFESQMAGVGVVTGATTQQMSAMTSQARELGATTIFSASEAAGGMEFLGRAGFETGQIMEALPGTLDLAAAGSLDLGRAADIASNALQAFGLDADEMGRVSDVMAAAAASANTNVQQLAEGLKMAAPIAAGFGVEIEDTTAAIGTLSNAGLQASMAGTGLRRVLTELANPSDELAEHMGGLSLQTDGFNAVMGQLAGSTMSASDAMDIFGQRGGPTFNVLRRGARSTEELSDALRNAEGEAMRQAENRLGSMELAMRQLNSATEELMLQMGDGGLAGAVSDVGDRLTEFARSDQAVTMAQNLGGAVRGAADAFEFLASHIDTVVQAATIFAGIRLGARLGPWGAVIGGVAGAIVGYDQVTRMATTATELHVRALQDLRDRLREIEPASEDAAQSARDLARADLEAAAAALRHARARLRIAETMVHPSPSVAQKRLEETRAEVELLDKELHEAERALGNVLLKSRMLKDQDQGIMIPGEDFALFGHRREGTTPSDGEGDAEVDSFQRMTQMIRERTDAIRLEQDVLNESVGAQEAARVEHELRNAALEAEIPLTDTVRGQIADLAQGYGEAAQGLQDMREAQRQAAEAQQFFGDIAFSALDSIIVRGEDAADVMRRLAQAIASAALEAAILGQGPLAGLFGTAPTGGNQLGGLLGALFNARGNVFQDGRVQPFARGGVVRTPTIFPMARGVGLMGEAGPEAIMPLRRGADGNLGVQASVGGGDSVVVHMAPITISAPGADPAQLQRLQERVDVLRQSIPGMVVGAVKNARSRRAL